MTLTVGSLFSGIGGFELGFERAGFEIKWQVEIDPWCRRVLAKHWPDVPKYEDVRDVGAHNLERVDVIVGGFPCQDISNAGKRAGITGERSGLWSEYARIVRALRPPYVVVENVAALLHRGLDVVLRDLAACGYDAEWQCLPASAFGAPHRRDRLFIIAHTDGLTSRTSWGTDLQARTDPSLSSGGASLAYAESVGWGPRGQGRLAINGETQPDESSQPMAHTASRRCERKQPQNPGECSASQSKGGTQANRTEGCCQATTNPDRKSWPKSRRTWGRWPEPRRSDWWAIEPDVGRVANGVPRRVDRLRGLGNAVVPHVAQYVAECVKAHAEANQ